ncbi:PKD domain-containing protein [Deinococcus aquaticus]|uniref:PKD domain-containing protein n=1 Tax=Deinococcus aquaticus TaxID=328692 RepID=UPI003F47B847
MKKIALLLPLILAACGTQTAPQQTAHSAAGSMQTGNGTEYVAAFEAKVQNDLANLGLAGDLTAQVVVAGKSYLNVLKVNDSTARAYIKTTYPSSTGCTVDWGDGSVTAAQTPTPNNISTEQQNHVYASSGTYTIKLTCGTDIKISSFKAVVADVEFNLFDNLEVDYIFNDGGFNYGPAGLLFPLIESGFKFESGRPFLLKNGVLPSGHKSIVLHVNQGGPGRISAANGSTFGIKSITAGIWYAYGDNVMLSAYDVNGALIASSQFANDGSLGQPLETRQLNWSGVKYLEITGGYWGYLNVDDMVATINQ